MKRCRLLKIIALVLAVTASLPFDRSRAQTSAASDHPVAKLVEWELTANAELGDEALRRMAKAILERADSMRLPRDIQALQGFRTADEARKAEILAHLSTEDLKRIVTISAPIDYFEIRESDLQRMGEVLRHELKMDGLDQAKNLLKFERGGESYIRWPLHPLASARDSQIGKLIEETLGSRTAIARGFLQFHFTASRSLILFHNSYAGAVSLKVSLPLSEGPFKEKSIHVKEWRAWTRHNDWIAKTAGGGRLRELTLQHEPYGIAISNSSKHREDGFLVRSLGGLARGDYYLVPAFAILTDKVGGALARQNGHADPAPFWFENFIRPLSKGMAELRAYSGAEHTSPHSQNLMVQLDRGFRPTGRAFARDFDFYIDPVAFSRLNRWGFDPAGLVWSSGSTHYANFNLRHGLSVLPGWLSDARYNGWIEGYFTSYRQAFASVTGIPEGVAFDGQAIEKFTGHWWERVINGNYAAGQLNQHGLSFSVQPGFINAYVGWIAAGARPFTEPAPKRPYSLSEFFSALQTPSAYQKLEAEGSLENALKEAKELSLRQRKELMRWGVYAETVRSSFGMSQNVQALSMALQVLNAVDPQLAYLAAGGRSWAFGDVGPSFVLTILIEAITNEAERIRKEVVKIREGSSREVISAIAEIQKRFSHPLPSTADALAFRLKQSDDPALRTALALALASYAKDDATVRTFLEKNMSLVPEAAVPRVKHLIEHGAPAPRTNMCRKIFVSAN